MRSRYTDATLLEEKLENYVSETKSIVNSGKRQASKVIGDYLNRVEKSKTLSSLIKFHTREQGHMINASITKDAPEHSASKSGDLWNDLIEMKREIDVISV